MTRVADDSRSGALAPMQFSRRASAEPEINLIPFIDVLLVVLIFLVLTTTYREQVLLHVKLPVAKAEKETLPVKPIQLTVTAAGDYGLQGKLLADHTAAALSKVLAAQLSGDTQPVLIISADAHSSHQSVITAVEGARLAGIGHITFALRSAADAPRR
ncbi:MAG: biopolymer transporter ExbD [Betaproteobacteria bacterium]